MTNQDNYRSFHDLRQPIAAIMNFANAGARMADSGAEHHALKSIFAQIQAQAEHLGELCKIHENSSKNGDAGNH